MTDYRSTEEKLKAAAQRSVTLVAVSKFHPYEAVMEAYGEGARVFGENRVQEMCSKFPPKGERPEGMKVFLIGQLQRNKVKKAVEWADRIESVDSIALIDKIEAECAARSIVMDILLELNSSGEESKSGFRSDDDLLEAAQHALGCSHLRVRGIMTIGPLGGYDEAIRSAFTRTSALYGRLREIIPYADVLSMGMSADWPIALECGSDEVRIGTAIFGERVKA